MPINEKKPQYSFADEEPTEEKTEQPPPILDHALISALRSAPPWPPVSNPRDQ